MEQWISLTHYFKLIAFETESLGSRCEFISSSLIEPSTKLYFYFFSYVLRTINIVNKEFQSTETKNHLIIIRSKFLFRFMIRNFIKPNVISSAKNLVDIDIFADENLLPLNEVFCGVHVENYLSDQCIDNEIIYTFKKNCQNFYKIFCKDMVQRIDFKDKFLNSLQYLSPEKALSGEMQCILPLLKIFNNINEEIINTEWRQLFDYDELKKFENLSIESFWSKISSLKNSLNEPMFQNLSKIVNGLLTLPHSTAAVERIFSQYKMIKTSARNRLHLQTCSSLLSTKDFLKASGCSCCDWRPNKGLLKRNFKSNENPKCVLD